MTPNIPGQVRPRMLITPQQGTEMSVMCVLLGCIITEMSIMCVFVGLYYYRNVLIITEMSIMCVLLGLHYIYDYRQGLNDLFGAGSCALSIDDFNIKTKGSGRRYNKIKTQKVFELITIRTLLGKINVLYRSDKLLYDMNLLYAVSQQFVPYIFQIL
jgi:hypothetical protein